MDSDDDNTAMFKVDHSEEYQVKDKQEEQLKNLFNKDTVIIPEGQKRKVIYGSMEKEERSLYQIMAPYLSILANKTGDVAATAGKGIYGAITSSA